MPASDDRLHQIHALIAQAIHDAVCTFSGSDGFGLCQLYTVAGYALLGRLDGPGRGVHDRGIARVDGQRAHAESGSVDGTREPALTAVDAHVNPRGGEGAGIEPP